MAAVRRTVRACTNAESGTSGYALWPSILYWSSGHGNLDGSFAPLPGAVRGGALPSKPPPRRSTHQPSRAPQRIRLTPGSRDWLGISGRLRLPPISGKPNMSILGSHEEWFKEGEQVGPIIRSGSSLKSSSVPRAPALSPFPGWEDGMSRADTIPRAYHGAHASRLRRCP